MQSHNAQLYQPDIVIFFQNRPKPNKEQKP